MPTEVKIGSAWETLDDIEVKIGSAWKSVDQVQVKVGSAWETVYPDFLITPTADGDVNSRATACYAGITFYANGDEYEMASDGTLAGTDMGPWLDAGSASDVWVVPYSSSGGWWDSGQTVGVRYNLITNRTFYMFQSGTGSKSGVTYFQFWDAAVGGNLLLTTANATWTATVP